MEPVKDSSPPGDSDLMGGGEPTHPGQALEPIPRVGAANPANDDLGPNVAGLASLPVGRHGALWLGVFAAAACSLALSRVWQYRYDVSADGLTYLDMADAFARRDWATAVNGTYNPLYSLLIGFVLAFFHPGPAMEGPAVQLLNLAIFAVAAASFVFLVRELQRYDAPLFRGAAESRNKSSGWGTALALIAAVIFAQVVLDLRFIGVDRVGPDLLVGAAFFLATALIIRILQKAATARTYLALGVVLALGYLAKAIFLPLTVVFLIAAFGAGGARSKAVRGVGISIAVFVLAAAPWIVALSLAKGRLTFGETGRLNYAWCVLGVPSPPHFWRGGDEFGTPSHPARLIERSPEVYEFDRPMRVTYPEWYDPSYWYEGMRLRPDFRKQALVIAYNARWYAHTFTGVPSKEVSVMEATDVWGLALLLFISGRGRRDSCRRAALRVDSLAGGGRPRALPAHSAEWPIHRSDGRRALPHRVRAGSIAWCGGAPSRGGSARDHPCRLGRRVRVRDVSVGQGRTAGR